MNLQTKEKFKPNYLVCYDNVNQYTIKHAQYFNIPIYVINTNAYEEQAKLLNNGINNDLI